MDCSARIWEGFQARGCSRKAVVEREGKMYCKIHDPEYIHMMDKKREEKYNKECCSKCSYHFNNDYYKFCPFCGQKRTKINS